MLTLYSQIGLGLFDVDDQNFKEKERDSIVNEVEVLIDLDEEGLLDAVNEYYLSDVNVIKIYVILLVFN